MRDGWLTAIRAEPDFGGLVDGVEGGDFDQNIGGGWKLAVDELDIAEGSEERCAARSVFLPSLAGGKA